MARRELDFTVDDKGGRDAGKKFLITEMPAMQAEYWGYRFLTGMVRNGVPLSRFNLNFDETEPANNEMMATLSYLTITAFFEVPFAESAPLLGELLGCVKIKEPAITRALTPDDIEEVDTYATLRMEVVKFHSDFFVRVVARYGSKAAKAKGSQSTQTSQES